MNTEEFLEALKNNQELDYKIILSKNHDYAGKGDPFKNFRLVEALGISSLEEGILVRLSDKMSRICTLINETAMVKDESIYDTLKDMRNYCNILEVYLKDKNSTLCDYNKVK